MKKLIIWILSILSIIVVVDILFGYGVKRYSSGRSLKGDYRSTDHLINDSIEELVVLGSSVALNSINTQTLSDSLGFSAYNAGANGQSFPFYLTMLEIIVKKPGLKTIILGMSENTLYTTGLGSRYNFLVPYYGQGYDGIDRRLESVSLSEKYFLKSSLYRYNTIWFRMLLYSFTEPGIKNDCGFIAKEIPAVFPNKITYSDEPHASVSDERAAQFEQFVKICREKDIRLIVCITPRYEQAFSSAGEYFLRERVKKNDFELWYDATSTPISNDSMLFYDNLHLNFLGAEQYTDTIISRLKQ